MAMNPEIKQLWLDALRSGDYKQGTGQLRDYNDNYCCLGVLCDVVRKKRKIKGFTGAYFQYRENEHYGFPPKKLLESIGILEDNIASDGMYGNHSEEATIIITYKGKRASLSELNDDFELSFKKIANIIEKQL